MAQVFIGSLMLVPYNFAPVGFALCQGQTLGIAQNTALFSLLGTTFGGNGTSNFMLPNLQGNLAVGAGQAPGLSLYTLGGAGGTPAVNLTGQGPGAPPVPPHTHSFMAADAAVNSASPTGCALAKPASTDVLYTSATTPAVGMNPSMVQPAGGGQPHNNMMPGLGLNWIIALTGLYPSRP
jgi:microcystin-dependent protein